MNDTRPTTDLHVGWKKGANVVQEENITIRKARENRSALDLHILNNGLGFLYTEKNMRLEH